MAYNREKLYQQALEAIGKNNLFFMEDLIAFLPCAKPTFYELFPLESNEMNNLKELLEQNKVKTKSSIRLKLFGSSKASELLSLYRMICTPEERQNINQSYIELTGKDGKDIANTQIIVSNEAQHKVIDDLLKKE
jgi:hypothetical protein